MRDRDRDRERCFMHGKQVSRWMLKNIRSMIIVSFVCVYGNSSINKIK